MTLVSRLTLIAYLVGGWLLPATHYHAHHGHEACHHLATSHSDATCGQSDNENDETSDRCCGHTDHCETASDAPQREIDEYYSAAAAASILQRVVCTMFGTHAVLIHATEHTDSALIARFIAPRGSPRDNAADATA